MSCAFGVDFLLGTESLPAACRADALAPQAVVTVVARAPSIWFGGHKFTYHNSKGGMAEESTCSACCYTSTPTGKTHKLRFIEIDLHTDGTFSLKQVDHTHDYGYGEKYIYDATFRGTGTWICPPSGESVTLSGTAQHTWQSRGRMSRQGAEDQILLKTYTRKLLSGEEDSKWRREAVA
eukprot:2695814-Amphidinium_carterae.1